MPDTAPHFSGKRWKAPNISIASISGNIKNHNVYVADLVLKRQNVKGTILKLLKKIQTGNSRSQCNDFPI